MEFDPDGPALNPNALFGLPGSVEDAALVVIPVPWQATTSYLRGTREAPMSILKASAQVDLSDRETGEPWRHGIAMLPFPSDVWEWDVRAEPHALDVIAGYGDPEPVNRFSERVNDWVFQRAREIIGLGAIPVVLGGDHSTPYGLIQALVEAHGEIGILHIDAHADLRDAYEGFTWSHASIMFNVMTRLPVQKLVQVGIRDFGAAERRMIESDPRIRTFFDADLAWEAAPWRQTCERIVAELPQKVYISWDIDGLDPSICPGTGTPVPGGLSWQQACVLLRVLGESGRTIVGFDLVEVGAAEWDANVGARLLYKMAGWALKSRQPPE